MVPTYLNFKILKFPLAISIIHMYIYIYYKCGSNGKFIYGLWKCPLPCLIAKWGVNTSQKVTTDLTFEWNDGFRSTMLLGKSTKKCRLGHGFNSYSHYQRVGSKSPCLRISFLGFPNRLLNCDFPLRLSAKNREWFLEEYATDLALYQEGREVKVSHIDKSPVIRVVI